MKILAFDTCLDKMYVALGEDNKVLAAKIVETTQSHYHSAFLISTITNILKENNLTPNDINVIATNIGPGSFTGIRACTTVARVFAQAAGIKTIGVSSLEILSRIKPAVYDSQPTLVALDARKEMAYVAIFDNGKQILSPKTILIEELKKIIAKNNYFIVTDNRLEPVLGGISYQKPHENSDKNFGNYLIQIANEKINSNCETDWKKLLPLYIQPPALNIKKNKLLS